MGATSVLVVLVSFGACGGSDQATEERIDRERREAEEAGRQKERVRQLENRLRQQDGGGGDPGPAGQPPPTEPAAPSSGLRSCGDGVSANSNTTCPFALNVKEAYFDGGQSGSLDAYSPALDRSISMSCSSGSPHVCTGGDDAEVQFR